MASFTYTDVQLAGKEKGRGRGLPNPFLKIKKVPWYCKKKCPVCVHLWVKFLSFKSILEEKHKIIFPAGSFFVYRSWNVHRSDPVPRNLNCPEKFLVVRLICKYDYHVRSDKVQQRIYKLTLITKDKPSNWSFTRGPNQKWQITNGIRSLFYQIFEFTYYITKIFIFWNYWLFLLQPFLPE